MVVISPTNQRNTRPAWPHETGTIILEMLTVVCIVVGLVFVWTFLTNEGKIRHT